MDKLPPQASPKARESIAKNLRKELDTDFPKLSEKDKDKIISDLPSYQGWPSDKPKRPREV